MDRQVIDRFGVQVSLFLSALGKLEKAIVDIKEWYSSMDSEEEERLEGFDALLELVHNAGVEVEIVRQELDELASGE